MMDFHLPERKGLMIEISIPEGFLVNKILTIYLVCKRRIPGYSPAGFLGLLIIGKN